MTQQLFFEPETYLEKTAAEAELPEDPNQWPQEVLQELYKQVPYIADFEPHVNMDRVDGEKGFGFGHVEVMNQTEAQSGTEPDQLSAAGIRSVRVPIIIKNGKLCPFDILITDDSKMRPLTEGRLRAAIFRPQAFDVTGRSPGDQSMIGQLYPPYRQNYGFGGGGVAMDAGMGKEGSAEFTTSQAEADMIEMLGGREKTAAALDDYFASEGIRHGRLGKKTAEGEAKLGMLDEFIEKNAAAKGCMKACLNRGGKEKCACVGDTTKTGSVLQAILSTINESDYTKFAEAVSPVEMQAAMAQNKYAIGESLSVLAGYDSNRSKIASVLQNFIRPTVVQIMTTEDGYLVKSANHKFWNPATELIQRGELIQRFGEKIALAADTDGAVTMAEGAETMEPEADADAAKSGAITESGLYKVMDTQGNEHIGQVIVGLVDSDGTELPLSMFTNGSKAAVQGDIIGTPAGEAFELPTGDLEQKKGYGFFFSNQNGELMATIPFDLQASFQGPDGVSTSQGETFDGRAAEVSVQPNVQTVVGTPDGKTLIPQGWQWSPLESSDALDLASTEAEEPKEAAARRSIAMVDVRCDGATFSIEGPALSKVATADKQFMDIDQAMFLLAGLGVDQKYGVAKLGQAYAQREPIAVRAGRVIETSDSQKTAAMKAALALDLPNLRKDLVKEAAHIPDPIAVDTVLSLGFINPENVMTFVSYLPVLEDAQSRMCELLVASRLGLQNISSSALEKAIRSTEEALEGLKILAFQGG